MIVKNCGNMILVFVVFKINVMFVSFVMDGII